MGGWAEGLEAAGWDVIRLDIEDMFAATGTPKPERCLLLIQDMLTFHGSQARNCQLIVASPPCTEYSWMAMPWSRAKQVARALRGEDEFPDNYRGSRTIEQLNGLFDACFRIQREASEAAGRHIPIVVENVRGAQPWVGRARWSWGSFFLWGDVPALMPKAIGAAKAPGYGSGWVHPSDPRHTSGLDFTRMGGLHADGRKLPGFRFDGSGRSFQSEAVKVASEDGGRRTDIGKGARFTSRDCGVEGNKAPSGTRWFNDGPRTPDSLASSSRKSPARKVASARIAKIPFTLSHWIGRCYLPTPNEKENAA